MEKSSGVGFLGLLAVLFIGLKLGGVIAWSWWLVLLPIYGPLAFFIAIGALAFFVGLFAALVIEVVERRNGRRR